MKEESGSPNPGDSQDSLHRQLKTLLPNTSAAENKRNARFFLIHSNQQKKLKNHPPNNNQNQRNAILLNQHQPHKAILHWASNRTKTLGKTKDPNSSSHHINPDFTEIQKISMQSKSNRYIYIYIYMIREKKERATVQWRDRQRRIARGRCCSRRRRRRRSDSRREERNSPLIDRSLRWDGDK